MGKTWAKELSVFVEKLDEAYRSGDAQASDKQFDQLENRLKEIDPQNSYFQQKMKLLSLDNYCFSEWWAKSARGETMIVSRSKFFWWMMKSLKFRSMSTGFLNY